MLTVKKAKGKVIRLALSTSNDRKEINSQQAFMSN